MRVSLKSMVVIAALSLLAWTRATQARDVVIGYSGRTIAEMPFAWGSRKGFFKEANLDVKMIYMSTSIAAGGPVSTRVIDMRLDSSAYWVAENRFWVRRNSRTMNAPVPRPLVPISKNWAA